MKVGIYPGAFDPVHAGHVSFAKAAIAKYKLDKVFFLPEPTPRHKQGVKALEHRAAMLSIVAADDDHLGVIELNQPKFTVLDTWPLITARFEGAELYMLLGSDVAARLASWPHVEEFAHTPPRFVIAARGQERERVSDGMTILQQTKNMQVAYDIIDTDFPTYGSSHIRATFRAGKTPEGVHQGVAEYIATHKLYTPQSN